MKKLIVGLLSIGVMANSFSQELNTGVRVVRIRSVCKGFKNCSLIDIPVSKKKLNYTMYAGIHTYLNEFWGKIGQVVPVWSTYHIYITNKTDSYQRYTFNLSLTVNESMHQETIQVDIPPTDMYEHDFQMPSDAQSFEEGDFPMYAAGSISGIENSDDTAMNYFIVKK